MEILKHECGVAMVRLLKPLEYYKKKYGSYAYGISKLYLLMEKQHNRGQEGAGIGVVKMHSVPGNEYVFRERALGKDAIQEIFETVKDKVEKAGIVDRDAEWVERYAPFLGEIYMGHLRYSTTGKSGLSYCHPFLRRNNWRSRNLLMCGNFNMTNVDQVFDGVVACGQHPRIYSDTVVLLEQLGDSLDKENHRIYRQYRDSMEGQKLSRTIEDNLDMQRVLSSTAPQWDGGFVIVVLQVRETCLPCVTATASALHSTIMMMRWWCLLRSVLLYRPYSMSPVAMCMNLCPERRS